MTYLVLGGTGFIGRNLVDYLIKEEVATKIRVVDKRAPEMNNLSEAQEKAYEEEAELLEFVQADLSRDAMVAKAFAGQKFNVVVNCAGDNELGLDDAAYEERIVNVSKKCATEAAKIGAKFIQISDARIYKPGKLTSEEGKISPQTKLASAHLKAEEFIKTVPGLNYTILRPAVVYGPGDKTGLMPRCVLASTYVYLKEVMKMPFGPKVVLSTVHSRDLAAAIVEAAKAPSGEVYNVADPGQVTLGELNKFLEDIFKIQTEFVSGAMNLALKAATNTAAEIINDKHMKPWGDYCAQCKIDSPILSPFLSPETLIDDDLIVNGTKICKALGFNYKYQKPSAALLLDSVNYFRKQDQFPNAETTVEARGFDYIWNSGALLPTQLFDAIGLFFSEIDDNTLTQIFRDIYQPKAAPSQAAAAAQLQLLQLSKMDENCNVQDRQKPLPYVICVCGSAAALEVAQRAQEQLKASGKYVIALKFEGIDELIKAQVTEVLLALAHLQQLHPDLEAGLRASRCVKTLCGEAFYSVWEGFDTALFGRSLKQTKENLQGGFPFDESVLFPASSFDLTSYNLEQISPLVDKTVRASFQLDYSKGYESIAAFAPPLVLICAQTQNGCGYQIQAVGKLCTANIDKQGILVLRQAATPGFAFCQVLRVRVDQSAEIAERYAGRFKKTPETMRDFVASFMTEKKTHPIAAAFVVDAASKLLNIVAIRRSGLWVDEDQRKMKFYTRGDLVAEINIAEEDRIYQYPLRTASGETATLVFVQQPDGAISDFLCLKDPPQEIQPGELEEEQIKGIALIFAELTAELLGMQHQLRFFELLIFTVPYQRAVSIDRDLSQSQMQRLFELARPQGGLQSISIKNQKLKDGTLQALLRCIQDNPGLESLEISNTELLSPSQYASLAWVLCAHPRQLDLRLQIGFASRSVSNVVNITAQLQGRCEIAGNAMYISRVQLAQFLHTSKTNAHYTTNEQKLAFCLNDELNELQPTGAEAKAETTSIRRPSLSIKQLFSK